METNMEDEQDDNGSEMVDIAGQEEVEQDAEVEDEEEDDEEIGEEDGEDFYDMIEFEGEISLAQACTIVNSTTDTEAQNNAIRAICSKYLSSWLSAETTNNRLYMSQTGTTKKIVELLSSDISEIQEAALLCVWGFGETAESREELAQFGAVPKVIELAKSEVQSVRLAALGALWCYLEYSDVQVETVAHGIVPFLINTPNIFHIRESEFRSQTTLVGCIFCCAWSEACRPILIEQGVPEFMFSIYDSYEDSVSVQYFCILCLALLTQDDSSLQKLNREQVLSLITKYLENHTPAEIARVEEQDQFAWKTLLPFFELTQSKITELRWLGIFCISHLAMRMCNVKIFQAENFIPQLLCLTWDPHTPTRELAKEVVAHLRPPNPPSLLDITRAKIRLCPALYKKADLYEEVKNT